jgi:hypothetical protein
MSMDYWAFRTVVAAAPSGNLSRRCQTGDYFYEQTYRGSDSVLVMFVLRTVAYDRMIRMMKGTNI